jgi:hypothetical protein
MRSQHLNRCPYTRCTLGGFERVEHELTDNSLSIVSFLEHNLAANNLCNVDEKEDANDKKTALHKKNIQLDIEGPCDPWTPTFEMKRSMSRDHWHPLFHQHCINCWQPNYY